MIALTRRTVTGLEIVFWLALAASYVLFPGKLVLITQILIAGLFAVGLDIALGYAGILTVGHAAFFGIGAYGAGLLARHGWGEPFSGLLLAAVVCLAIGYLLSYLIVRGADLTRLMITIGVCVLFGELANRLSDITGGADGLQGIEMWPVFGQFRFDMAGKTGFVYAFCIVLLVFLGVRLMLRSPFGMVLRGIHDNRRRMLAIGSPVDARLRLAYAFSAAIAGIAGALLAQTTQFVGLEMLSFNRSAEVLIILVLGGTGRLYGGLIGALLYMTVHDLFSDFDPKFWMFWLGIFLIAVVMLGRGGVLGGLSRVVAIKDER
ncbi:branched-chain amino acid ABC transporter permease [Pigmentiphaga litoralis]|uniref:Branched-chain amino acid transport system permease protein n=1 Tax=Pigmentiphaga litoralis TaxID=516702 RepID=A0A7Y9IQ06_9BURK|nr:branched-chain amino acid ABC transporter permease [Pigmentiphaga litoralis]NYE25443.1 branched-chain amino acid transport system permease protein [Pigmentiphaga litoralis]NYE80945.1 branched-chain amino acid transport system permease protein [Pigmentiphaga litoralis]